MVAVHAVIELQEGLAISCRAANVGKNQRHPQLIGIKIVPLQESGTELSFRPAVNVDDYRTLAGKLLGIRRVEETRDCLSVEGRPLDQLWFGESGRVQPAGFAGRPPVD